MVFRKGNYMGKIYVRMRVLNMYDARVTKTLFVFNSFEKADEFIKGEVEDFEIGDFKVIDKEERMNGLYKIQLTDSMRMFNGGTLIEYCMTKVAPSGEWRIVEEEELC